MEDLKTFPEEIRNKTRVLVVEDNLLNQKLDAFLLSNWKINFEMCDDGQKAIDLLRREHFDLVLMDIQLPVVNGFEATRVIRTELGLDVPVIGITAHPTPGEKAVCLSRGMNSYLAKPVDEEKLFELICRHILPQHVENAPEEKE